MVAIPAMYRIVFSILFAIFAICSPPVAADAMMRNQSVEASTIVQYYVDEQGVQVELEIGIASVDDFRNLMPTGIYREMGFGDSPLAERLQVFFEQDLTILVEGKPLPGFIASIGPSRRVLRDPINGVPLPVQDDAPQVIRATLRYPFPEGKLPGQLGFRAPRVGNIGFVAYHNGVAINDYRYLSSGYTLTLDWEVQDPKRGEPGRDPRGGEPEN